MHASSGIWSAQHHVQSVRTHANRQPRNPAPQCILNTHTPPPPPTRVQGLYLNTSRELKRLDALAFSPIFQHYAESLAGLPTIRAFQRQALFEDINRVRRHGSWSVQGVEYWGGGRDCIASSTAVGLRGTNTAC
jgi:hypothetical protein